MDYGDKPAAAKRSLLTPPRWSLFAPPLTAERNPLSAKVHELEAKVARLEKELHTAHTILDVQGKVAGLLGFSLEHGKDC